MIAKDTVHFIGLE
jgi:hypothetical protein